MNCFSRGGRPGVIFMGLGFELQDQTPDHAENAGGFVWLEDDDVLL